MTDFTQLVLNNTGCRTPGEHLLRAGGVERYHNEPGVPSQAVSAHTWRLLSILLTIWPDASRNLIIATQFHDVGEGLTGDLPAPLKWGDAELNKRVGELDDRYTYEFCGVPELELSSAEIGQMKVADYLELTDYCANFTTPAANRIMKHGFNAVVRYSLRLDSAQIPALGQWVRAHRDKWTAAFLPGYDTEAREFRDLVNDFQSTLRSHVR